MKTIGMIGGMSWESTVTYYQIVNEVVKRELGGLHSAKVLMYSVDFDEIERYQAAGEWDESARILGDAAANLEKAGADFIVICTNTMHKVAPDIARRVSIPILHIAEATAQALKAANVARVGLLGTKYTMTQAFYKDVLTASGIDVLVPQGGEIDEVNSVIYDELCLGDIRPESRHRFLEIIEGLRARGAQGVILGCTEIGLLVKQADTDIPVFDTTLIHAERAAMRAIGD